MSDIVIAEVVEEEDYDAQIRDALEKSLEIYGTVMNDLEYAINVGIQYQRAFKMLGGPDPQEERLRYLVEKYNMARENQAKTIESIKALTAGLPPELNT